MHSRTKICYFQEELSSEFQLILAAAAAAVEGIDAMPFSNLMMSFKAYKKGIF